MQKNGDLPAAPTDPAVPQSPTTEPTCSDTTTTAHKSDAATKPHGARSSTLKPDTVHSWTSALQDAKRQAKAWLDHARAPTPNQPGLATSFTSADPEKLTQWVKKLKTEWQQTVDVEALRQNPRLWVTMASRALNRITGYHVIDQLKQSVITKEQEFFSARQALDEAKLTYDSALTERSHCQREINNLLQRKHLWTDADVTQFTELYRHEHLHEQAEGESKHHLQRQEKLVEQKYSELVDAIRIRYHEEQLWSDKIRAAATYGTWAVLSLNLLVFAFVHIIIEPRKRKKLMDHMETVVQQAQTELQATGTQFAPAAATSLSSSQSMAPAWMAPLDQRLQRLEEIVASINSAQVELIPALLNPPPPQPPPPTHPMVNSVTEAHELSNTTALRGPIQDKGIGRSTRDPNEPPQQVSDQYTREDVVRYIGGSAVISCAISALVTLLVNR
ncbi:sensitivity to high expression protein she9 [Dimargaris verticillata]|uniref:Sensitive to high expression protein 9, mitochondrial n=1 Tax=Dimargaris verticillata TaxID=2761393 RepID=A0A9W8B130_9FUNG|nr:sensitivity to high expression protein she9 [Dimargaris verticillata]